jgi:hypothetical protein
LAANDAGGLFVGTPYQIFKHNLATGLIAPFAGDGTNGFTGDGGPALNARFASITALATAPGGGLVIADSDNARIRYIVPDSVKLTNDNGQTSFTLPWVNSLTGDLILSRNPSLTNIDASAVTNVGGVVSIGGNASAGVVDLGSLQSAGEISISTNTSAVVISLGSLGSVAGEVNIGGNSGALTIDLSSLTNAGAISMGGNTAASTVDLSSLQTAGSVSITSNTSATVISMGSATSVAGEVEIAGNTGASEIDLGSLSNAGDVTIESNAPNAVISMSSLTNYGCAAGEITMTLNGGTVEMTNGLTLCTNATLTGSTTVDGSVTNNGTIEPGSSPGRLNITGNLWLNSASRLHLEIGGYANNEFDSVNVGDSATLGGNISVSLFGNFKWVMTNGSSFTVLTAGTSLAGVFANAASGAVLTTTDGYARFTLLTSGDNTVRLTNLQIVDTDADGMPDWWEDHFGLSKTNSADAGLDLDGDRALNAAEFSAGTDPTSPASVFRLISIQCESNGVRLTWSAIGGKTYRVQTNGTLPGDFADNGAGITAAGTGVFITNILNADAITNGSSLYYRLRLGP